MTKDTSKKKPSALKAIPLKAAPELDGKVRYLNLTSMGKPNRSGITSMSDQHISLLIYHKGVDLSSPIFFGIQPKAVAWRPSQQFKDLGVKVPTVKLKDNSIVDIFDVDLAPGVLYSLFKCPLDKFSGKIVPLEKIIGKQAEVFKPAMGPMSHEKRAEILNGIFSELFKNRLETDPKIQLALDEINSSSGCITLLELASRTGCSPRWLRDLFKKWIGAPPHLFCNNIKIICAMKDLYTGKTPAETALNYGYTDQAHFIKDFKLHTGMPPARMCAHFHSNVKDT